MKKLIILLPLVALIVAGCSQMKGTRRPMSDAEKTFRANCRSCHILPKPTEKESGEWPIFLKAHSEDKDIPAEDIEKIVEYLQEEN